MSVQIQRLATALVTSAVLSYLAPPAGAAESPETCARFRLESQPGEDPQGWTISGIWTKDEKVVLADAKYSKLREFSTTDGRELRTFQSLSNVKQKSFRPSSLQSTSDGFAVLENNGRISWLGSSFTTTKQIELTEFNNSAGQRIGSVFSWALARNTILTFSDLENKDRSWTSAFLRIPISSPGAFSTLNLPPLDDDGRDLYLYGHPYITASSTHGYVLLMQKDPAIFEFNLNGTQKVRKLSVGSILGPRPSLPKKQGVSTVRALYAAVEKSSMPVGLFFENDRLFMLARRPTQNGTSWLLYRIDVTSGQTEATLEIPSSANHLTVIPGPTSWLFLEKGPVLGLGEQSVLGALSVPAKDLTKGLSGPLCGSNGK